MKYLLYILNILILPALWSCTNDDVPFKQDQQEGEVLLTLTLKSATLTTRTEAGVTDLNENAIHKVDLFLYPTGKTNENAVVQITDINNFTSQDDGEVTFTVPITSEQKDYLFPAGSNNICVGYAIANRPGNFSAPKKTVDDKAVDDTSMEALKNIVISSTTFEASEDKGTDDQKTIAIKAGRQADFVMDGYTDGTTYKIMLTSNDSQEIVTGTIPLDRAASKITLEVTVTGNVTEDGVTWTPGNAEVLLYHGVKKAKVDVTYNANTTYTPEDVDYFDLTGENARQLTKSNLNYTQEVPFYSYSSDWGNGDKEAYLVLVLYWTPQVDGGTPTPFYYRVPINPESNNIVRNTYYKINLEVGILGSRELSTETVELSPSCILLDWGNNNITADLKQPRYLVVDKDIVYVYNDENCKVEYETSHVLSYEIISITKPNYTAITASTDVIYDKENKVGSTDGFSLTVSNGIINVNNPLDNNINSDDFDYVPYTIKVKVWHNDNSDYSREVTFIQYPAIYVENSLNEGTTDTGSDNNNLNHNNYTEDSGFGYVMVNTLYSNRYDYDNSGVSNRNIWQTVEGFDRTSNNPNMYIVTSTVLDNNLGYILGDSRESETYSDDQLGINSIVDVNGKQLENYRPTKTDRNDYLSPKFRISSAYGQLGNNDMSIANAKKRCAAYQEYGYPAGRWRLPTTAELSYIAKLCAKGALPISLFGGSSYWSATQAYYVSQGNVSESSDNSAYLRCVYDDWYWGSNALNKKDKFTWGDESTTDELNKMDSQK